MFSLMKNQELKNSRQSESDLNEGRKAQAPYHHNVNAKLRGVIRDQCEEDIQINHSAEELIRFLY